MGIITWLKKATGMRYEVIDSESIWFGQHCVLKGDTINWPDGTALKWIDGVEAQDFLDRAIRLQEGVAVPRTSHQVTLADMSDSDEVP